MAEADVHFAEHRPSAISRGAKYVLDLLRGRSISEPTDENEKLGDDAGDDLNLGVDDDAAAEELHADNIDRRRDVQSLPPWIHSLQAGENTEELKLNSPLIPSPPRLRPAHHNYLPSDPKSEPNVQAGRGKQWNHLRTKEAVTLGLPGPDYHSRWMAFAQSSVPPDQQEEEGHIVSEAWKRANLPDLDEPWRPASIDDNLSNDKRLWLFSSDKRMASLQAFHRVLMRNPFIPLIIRLVVLAFTIAALVLGVRIYRESQSLNDSSSSRSGTDVSPETSQSSYICKQQASTYMAFIVDSVAVVYLGYITYDEYFSKPLGMRPSKAKMRLLFLDLFFIIFSAANLSLAFNTLTDTQWSCYESVTLNNNNEAAARSTCVQNNKLCLHQRGLCSVMFVAEIAWVLTFAISVLRVVERIQA